MSMPDGQKSTISGRHQQDDRSTPRIRCRGSSAQRSLSSDRAAPAICGSSSSSPISRMPVATSPITPGERGAGLAVAHQELAAPGDEPQVPRGQVGGAQHPLVPVQLGEVAPHPRRDACDRDRGVEGGGPGVDERLGAAQPAERELTRGRLGVGEAVDDRAERLVEHREQGAAVAQRRTPRIARHERGHEQGDHAADQSVEAALERAAVRRRQQHDERRRHGRRHREGGIRRQGPADQEDHQQHDHELPQAGAQPQGEHVGERDAEQDAEQGLQHPTRPRVAGQAERVDRDGHREQRERVPEPPVGDRVRRRDTGDDLHDGRQRLPGPTRGQLRVETAPDAALELAKRVTVGHGGGR